MISKIILQIGVYLAIVQGNSMFDILCKFACTEVLLPPGNKVVEDIL